MTTEVSRSAEPNVRPMIRNPRISSDMSTAPEIAVSGNGVNISNGDALPGPADHTSFDTVSLSGPPLTRTYTIRNLGNAPLDVTAELARTTITLRDLLEMQPGDVIETGKLSSEPVTVCIGEPGQAERKFLASLGQHRGNRALRIIRAMKEQDRVV